MPMPNLGARVVVRPTAPNVQDGAGMHGRFMQVEGKSVVIDEWWAARLRDGSVVISEPDAAATPTVKATAKGDSK
jgi:hypothetical protein